MTPTCTCTPTRAYTKTRTCTCTFSNTCACACACACACVFVYIECCRVTSCVARRFSLFFVCCSIVLRCVVLCCSVSLRTGVSCAVLLDGCLQDQVVTLDGPLVHVTTMFFFFSLPPLFPLSHAPVCRFKTSPCVRSKRPRVYRHPCAEKHVRVLLAYTETF